MINLAICGINGTMGKHVYDRAIKDGLNVVCGIDKFSVGSVECPIYKSFDQIKDFVDVIIDFSSPEVLPELLDYAKENKIPIVIGTTGFSKKEENLICESSKEIAIFKSANTSIGINLAMKLCKTCAETLSDYDVEIIDKHHKNKNDSPSGTTLMLFNAIENCYKEMKKPIFGRNGKGKRKACEIGLHSVRGGTIIGTHEINFFGENESITIIHTAHSKELFANGALKAAKFIKNKKVGLFSMNDLI